MKKIFTLLVLAVVVIGAIVLLTSQDDTSSADQLVLQKTLDISQSYTLLRLQTDDILMNARNYESYERWQAEMEDIVLAWSELEAEALILENLADTMSEADLSFNLVPSAVAYNRQEISDIFDRAPAGKKIATLAKHLGVDAKRAYAILTQDQAQVQADAWNEAGDTFKKLETAAVAIKDTSKVVTFVGTIAVSGGTAAIAAGSTLGKVAVVVAGADLTLEVTDDAAKIALGDKNKISTVVGSARQVTEPAAAVLMISTLPSNLTKTVDTLSAVTFGADQLNSSVQEGKVVGISLPTAVKTNPPETNTMAVSILETTEVEEWLKDEEVTETTETIAEIKTTLEQAVTAAKIATELEARAETADDQAATESVPAVDSGRTGTDAEMSDDAKLVRIEFINATNGTWVMDREPYGSQDYREELDAMDASDFAVGGGDAFISIADTYAELTRKGTRGFVETSDTTYEYKIQLIAGGPFPEDEDEQYVYAPFAAVEDFVVQGTYGQTVIVEWNGASFKQVD